MQTYNVSRLPSMITLGYDGENNWRPHSFDCSPLLANHPNGTISLWLLPHGETQAYPVALTRDGNTVVWTPLSEEMTARTGALQIVCTDGTDVGKSRVALFRVDESILPGAEHPAAVPSWATQTVERAEDAADRAEEAAESIDIDALEARIAQAVEAYLIEHPVEAPVESVNGQTGAVRLGASDVGALPDDTLIPAAVTEQTVAGWGFTKNTGTYSKPSGGIPASDIAAGVIPPVPQMATKPDMSDWTSGKTVDAAVLKNGVQYIGRIISGKADASDIPTDNAELANGAGYQTEQDVQTAIKPFEIHIIADGNGGYTTQESAEEIIAHVENCVVVLFGVSMRPDTYTASANDAELTVQTIDEGGTFANIVISIAENSVTVSLNVIKLKELPTISAADDGKTLVVSGGTWNLASDFQTKAITDAGGYFTTDTVEGALQEIGGKLLPSGGSAGDFLRKTASGVAWQTVPSAESASFGGGA